jgi:succinoglycan biosynthesis protein ExoA
MERTAQQTYPIRVSVVVPCRNEIRYIRAFLDSVFRQELGGIEMEVLIADGMSDDGTREVLREYATGFPSLRVIDNPEKIVSTGLNRAIREAKGEIIIRMDAHTLYAPDYVRSCVEVLHESNADNVGGPALTRAEGYVSQAIAYAFHTRFASGRAKFRDPRYEGPVDTVPYGCWRKSTLERIGLFDERMIRTEDYELNMRLVSSGGKLWQSPRITSWYWPRTSLSGLFWQCFQYGFWKVAVVRKHRRIASRRSFVPTLCLFFGAVLPLCAAGARLGGSIWWQNTFLAAWVALVGLYFTASFAAAFSVARRKGWMFFPFLPIVFATYQLPHALGSLLALLYRPMTLHRPNFLWRALTAITR